MGICSFERERLDNIVIFTTLPHLVSDERREARAAELHDLGYSEDEVKQIDEMELYCAQGQYLQEQAVCDALPLIADEQDYVNKSDMDQLHALFQQWASGAYQLHTWMEAYDDAFPACAEAFRRAAEFVADES